MAVPQRLCVIAACCLVLLGCRGAVGSPQQAAERKPPALSTPVTFDRARAWQDLLKQCSFGARPVGTDAHRRCRDYLVDAVKGTATRVVTQEFTYRGMPLTNVIGFYGPAKGRQVLLCAHWDTRPIADQEVASSKRRMPILGANDGASGVAVLLELGRMFKAHAPPVGVVVALLDGEDYGNFATGDGVFLGSRHLAKTYRTLCDPDYGILLDMVGDRDLTVYREANSESYARRVNDKVFGVARDLGYAKTFVDEVRYTIEDDHLPLNRAGIPTIDLIDFDYAPWHTLDDTPDQCSEASLEIVGRTVAETIYREKPKQ